MLLERKTIHRGHALLELMIALPLMAALIAAASGIIAVTNSSRSLATGLLSDRVNSLKASQRIISDFRFAQSVAEASPHAIEFSVADRDSDSMPETIRYSWSEIAGAPVLRSRNGSTAEIVAENIHRFAISYGRQTGMKTTIIKHHDDSAGGSFNVWPIESGIAASQYVVPDLPTSATKLTVSRIRLLLRSTGQPDGKLAVSITKSDAQGRPTDSIFQTTVIDESELDSNFAWTDFHFSSLDDLAAGSEFCIVVSARAGSDTAAELAFEQSSNFMTANTHFLTSSNSGLTWTIPNDSDDMRFYVFGEHDGASSVRNAYESVSLQLQVGSDTTALAISSTRLLNKPEADPMSVAAAPADPPDNETHLETGNANDLNPPEIITTGGNLNLNSVAPN